MYFIYLYFIFIQLIGWTPLIEMKKINASRRAAGVRLVGKMETYQPLSSVKDRTALGFVNISNTFRLNYQEIAY